MTDWTPLLTTEDAQQLSDACWGFHDATILGLRYTSGEGLSEDRHWMHVGFDEDTRVSLVIDTSTRLQEVEIEFIEPQFVLLNDFQHGNGLLFDAYLNFESIKLFKGTEEPYLFWAPFDGFDPKTFCVTDDTIPNHTLIIAKSGRWRSLADAE